MPTATQTAPSPTAAIAERLRAALLPETPIEEYIFDSIVRYTICVHFLTCHIESDPKLANPETKLHMRQLFTAEAKLRYHYEEYRRLKPASFLQSLDYRLALVPQITIAATHTNRTGYSKPPKLEYVPEPPERQFQKIRLDDAAVDAQRAAKAAKSAAGSVARPSPSNPKTEPPPTALNAPCPCGSGQKFKRCCQSKKAA